MTKVYSFDIFDTLLLRPYADPQEVWRVLEEEEKVVGFAKDRKNADAVTYRRLKEKGGETSIEEAYDLIPQWKHLMEKEIELERRVLRPNIEMLDLWKKLKNEGKRLVIISDMYLSSDFIKSVLEENGFSGWSGFYLSRDYNVRKATGELFRIVLEKEKIKPEELHHVGDNIHSDVEIPQSLGISVQHYPKVIDCLYEQFPFTRQLDGRFSGVLAIGLHQYEYETPEHTYWNRLGYIMGGVLGYMYVTWIVRKAKELNKDHLMFVARDGFIWKKICNALYPEIKTDYFYAPRITSIAVLGARGNDPRAIKDRQQYINENFKGVDIVKIKEEYVNYINQYNISNNSAIVDGCSSGFSAQSLVESSVGHNVYGFYLLAMARKENISAMYSTNLYSLPFQRLSEFLFGSSEAPIVGVNGFGPIYSKIVAEPELFKMHVSPDITEAAISCSKHLYKEGVLISGQQWLDYVDAFMRNLTETDKTFLYKARNATDVKQEKFNQIIYVPHRVVDFTLAWKRYIPKSIQIYFFKHRLVFGLNNKKVFFKHTDLKVNISRI